MTDKIAAYIGLAQRAGSVLYGEEIIVERKSKAKIVLIDSRAPEKYIARLQAKLDRNKVCVIDGLKDALHRENVNAVGITNADLADAILGSVRK